MATTRAPICQLAVMGRSSPVTVTVTVSEEEALTQAPETGEVLGLAISEDVSRLVENDPVVREGRDSEGIHQARVATRRLRSQLKTFRRALRSGPATRLSSELAWLGRLLGQVRDLDVIGERLSGDEIAAEIRPVLRRLSVERQEAYAELILAMGTKRYSKLLADLQEISSRPPVRNSQASRPASELLVSESRRRWEAFEQAVEALGPAPLEPALHHVRIMSKRVRYAAQVVAPLAPGAEALAKAAAKVQKVLGELNDGARSVIWLEQLKQSPWPEWPSETEGEEDPLIAVEQLLAAEHRSIASARKKWRGQVDRAFGTARALSWSSSPLEGDLVDPVEDLVVEPLEDLERGHVLGHLTGLAGTGDDGRHMRVVGTPGDR